MRLRSLLISRFGRGPGGQWVKWGQLVVVYLALSESVFSRGTGRDRVYVNWYTRKVTCLPRLINKLHTFFTLLDRIL